MTFLKKSSNIFIVTFDVPIPGPIPTTEYGSSGGNDDIASISLSTIVIASGTEV